MSFGRKAAPTKAASAHMGRIKSMPCICCELMGQRQTSPTDVHHVRQAGEPRNDWLTLPLCHSSCHQGPKGVEGDGSYLRLLKISEWGLLAIIIERIAK